MAIPPPSQQEAHTPKSHHLSAGTITGITIGGGIALVLLLMAVYLLTRKGLVMRAIEIEQERAELDMSAGKRYEMDGTPLKQELDDTQYHGSELDGRIHIGHEVEGSEDWIAELPALVDKANDNESQ